MGRASALTVVFLLVLLALSALQLWAFRSKTGTGPVTSLFGGARR